MISMDSDVTLLIEDSNGKKQGHLIVAGPVGIGSRESVERPGAWIDAG